MKKGLKVGLAATMAAALAIILMMGASIGSAAAPDPQLADDLVFMGNGKGTAADGNNIKVIDIDAMAVVNTIGAGGLLANNHGVLVDGGSIWSANAALATGKSRIVKLNLGTMAQTAYDVASANQYAFGAGLCGIEKAPDGKIWATSMSGDTGNGGIYGFNPDGTAAGFVDTSAGADNGATCGIGWNTSGSTAYFSLMNAKKLNTASWPGGGGLSTITSHTTPLHIIDVAKTANYAYVAAGKNAAGDGYLDVVDLSTNTLVNHIATTSPGEPHGPTVAHNEGFLYVHSRTGAGGTYPGLLLIYDIGGGTGGGTKANPVLIGSIADQGTPAVSCGTDVATKSSLCAKPALSLSMPSPAYWVSYADYTAGLLSVDYNISNGGVNAYNVTIAGSTATNGVTLASGAGAIGNIPSGTIAAVTLKYNVPAGIAGFKATVYATAGDLCGNAYSYPGPYPGP